MTRTEMAAFLIRALTEQTAAPAGAATATFADVPPGHQQHGVVAAMAARAITTGGGDPSATPRTYCPDAPVKRSEVAVFIIRA